MADIHPYTPKKGDKLKVYERTFDGCVHSTVGKFVRIDAQGNLILRTRDSVEEPFFKKSPLHSSIWVTHITHKGKTVWRTSK